MKILFPQADEDDAPKEKGQEIRDNKESEREYYNGQ